MNLLIATLALSLTAADPGTAVFPLLKIGQGPRAAALGEAFTGLADDATAIYWNPAGLGQVAGHQFAISHQQWFADIKDEEAHAAISAGPGTVGLGIVYTGEPDALYWNQAEQRYDSLRAWYTMVSAGYGLRIADRYRVGASLKGLYQDLNLETGFGGAIDIGAVGNPVDNLGVGIAVRHLGTMSYGAGAERLPMELAAGATYQYGMFRGTLDAVFPFLDNIPSVRAGVEFSPIEPLALRVGYRTGPVDLSGLGFINGLSAGIGVTVGNIGLDYAMVPYGELGMTHRIGLRLVAPPPVFGSQAIVVLDAETGQRLAANIAVSGVVDTVATGSGLRLTRVLPGAVTFRAAADEYGPETGSYTVVAGKHHEDTLRLKLLPSAIRGGVFDARTRRPIGGTVSYAGPLNGSLVVPAEPGTYGLDPARKGRYILDATGPTDEYLPQTCTLDVAAGETAERDFYLWKKGDLLYLMVNFETGKANILPEFDSDIDRAGAIIKQTPAIKKIELGGHTDPRKISTKEFPSNWELSQARAEAVRQYLIDKFGIEPDRLVAKGYADTKPIASNKTPEGMYQNRRTELKILE
jgi:outer membrane protein OmpA-like peptidoglycan-associated protein